jgi:hypothetical protein
VSEVGVTKAEGELALPYIANQVRAQFRGAGDYLLLACFYYFFVGGGGEIFSFPCSVLLFFSLAIFLSHDYVSSTFFLANSFLFLLSFA